MWVCGCEGKKPFVNKSLFSPRAPLFTKNFKGKTFFLCRKNILQLFLLFHFYGDILPPAINQENLL